MSPRSQVVLRDPGGITVHRTAIPSGPRVFTEVIPAVRSVTLGVWVPIGSRHETPATAGASHFLEHLLFKGTERRSALDIAADVESVGGEINAFTTKEYTCYHVRMLDEHLMWPSTCWPTCWASRCCGPPTSRLNAWWSSRRSR
ncbi:MAG: insulinase family protein [Micrococcales bacterium]|nr:insulinase family protein [Micrococcales bacterium]